MSDTDDSNFHLTLSVTNNATVKFAKKSWDTSSGHITTVNDIPASQTEPVALFAIGTSMTWTGLVGHASWEALLLNGHSAVVSLKFDMPYSGSNSGQFYGDATFNTYFTIDPNITMPGDGELAHLSATINPKN